MLQQCCVTHVLVEQEWALIKRREAIFKSIDLARHDQREDLVLMAEGPQITLT